MSRSDPPPVSPAAAGPGVPVGPRNEAEGGRHDGGWRKRRSRYLFDSRWYRVRQDELTLPDGRDITYTMIEHPGYVMVVPLGADGRVVMERIFRHTLQRTILECPAGGRDPGETPLDAARRELAEETGLVAERWSSLGSFYGSSGISDERFELFLAEELRDGAAIHREPGEQMEIERLPFAELHDMARDGRIEDGPSALALLLAWGRRGAR